MTSNAARPGIDTDELDTSTSGRRTTCSATSTASGSSARRDLPSDKARYGSFYLLAEEAEKAVRDIIIESQSAEPGTEGRKVGDLYASFLDEARIQALGAKPIAEAIAEAEKVDSIDSLLETLGRLERGGSSGFFQVFVDSDPGQPERYLVFLEQGGLRVARRVVLPRGEVRGDPQVPGLRRADARPRRSR